MGSLKDDPEPTPVPETLADAVPTTEAGFEKEVASEAGLTTLGDLDGI